jgi:hypothetical protein
MRKVDTGLPVPFWGALHGALLAISGQKVSQRHTAPMTRNWHEYPPQNAPEFEAMASVLEARHGLFAADIAEFFACLHDEDGDERRSHAWADVALLVRERQRTRLDTE